MTHLTRREFLSTVGAGIGVTRDTLDNFLLGISGKISQLFASAPEQSVTYEQALADKENKKGYRQKYLEQIVNEPHKYLDHRPYTQYFGEVVYDHDGSIARSLGVREEYIKDTHAITFYFSTPSNGKPTSTSFGTKLKPTLYVFGNAFDNKEIKIGNRTIPVQPCEERLFTILHHSYIHAKDMYSGINLENDLVISQSNYLSINPNIRAFVMETRAYINQLDFARKFGMEHSAYAFSLYRFAKYLYDVSTTNNLKLQNISATERRYVEHQINQIKQTTPEVLKVSEISGFPQKMGLN